MAAHPVDSRQEASLVEIVKHLRDDLIALFRQELALAKSEMEDKASRYIRNGLYLAVGAVAKMAMRGKPAIYLVD